MNSATLTVSLAAVLSATAVAQAPLDLGNWTAESYPAVSGFPAGNWVVAPDGLSVRQSANSQPTMFFSPFDVAFLRIDGQLTIRTNSDDDLVGFAIGFRPGDSANPNADYLLIDWKRNTQSFNFGAPSCTPGSTSRAGLAVSRVRGIPTADELWGHVNLDTPPCSGPNDSVTELARATTLGGVGWDRFRTYSFRFDFAPTRLDVYVDGFLELSVTGTFQNGRMAFYNFSQENVDYDAFTVSCTADATNYGTGLAGSLGVPGLRADTPPILGTTLVLRGDNVAGAAAVGAFLFGFAAADLPTPFGGRLLVDALESTGVLAPPSGGLTSLAVPANPAICGFRLFAQFVHADLGAAQGIAFSPGLRITLGT